MRKHGKYGKYRKYSDEDILVEANKYLESGMTIINAATILSMLISTLSWHLQYRLKGINYALWVRVYSKILTYTGGRRRYK